MKHLVEANMKSIEIRKGNEYIMVNFASRQCYKK